MKILMKGIVAATMLAAPAMAHDLSPKNMHEAIVSCQNDQDLREADASGSLLTVEQCAKRLLGYPAVAGSRKTCSDLVNHGLPSLFRDIPDVEDYVRAKPGSDKLGFDSDCYIDNLVFSQCWLKPKLTVKQAIDLLLAKARDGKKLPDTPACGA